MTLSLPRILALSLVAVLPAHALVGLGVHLAPAYGPEVKRPAARSCPPAPPIPTASC